MRLLISNHKQFRKGILISSLPLAFQHAIQLTRRLGYQYLWIDALCIIQDSQEGWLHEALLMSVVYSHSQLNLAATASTDGQGGLSHPYNPLLRTPCSMVASWEGLEPGAYKIFDSTCWRRHVDEAPLNQRAWVLQERLLAPRTAHFAYDQVWWECRAARGSETYPRGLRPAFSQSQHRPTTLNMIDVFSDLDASDPIELNTRWLYWVQEYTKTSLTKNSDKLIALAGIAATVQRLLKWPATDYPAGLWRQDLAVDLLWRTIGETSVKIDPYVAPSWSWASVRGEVYFQSPDRRAKTRENLAITILKGSVRPAEDGNLMGPVIGGNILIRGSLSPVNFSEPDVSIPGSPGFLRLNTGTRTLTQGDDFEECIDSER